MIPQVGQHVKCLLRTGVLAEGIVEDWGERTVQLRSLDEENILIITHPNDDIMLIKVVLNTHQSAAEKVAEKIRRAGPERPVPESADLKQKFQEVYDSPSDDDLRLKELADLKIMLIEQEKKIIADKLKSHHIGPINKAKYGYPNFIQTKK